jgi:hypothetical protein
MVSFFTFLEFALIRGALSVQSTRRLLLTDLVFAISAGVALRARSSQWLELEFHSSCDVADITAVAAAIAVEGKSK